MTGNLSLRFKTLSISRAMFMTGFLDLPWLLARLVHSLGLSRFS